MPAEHKKNDDLVGQAGGYFSLPSEDNMAYTELLFDICQQFGIHYYISLQYLSISSSRRSGQF